MFFFIQVTASDLGLESEKQAIDAAHSALGLYNKYSTETVSWNGIKDIIQEIKAKTGIPKEHANLVGGTVTHLMNAMDSYFNVIQNMREWCGVAKPLLTVYSKKLNEPEHSAAKTTLLVRVLGHEVDKMNRAQSDLRDISSNFKDAAEKMTPLRNHFGESCEKVNRAYISTEETSEKLKEKIQMIRNLKTQIEEAESLTSTAEFRAHADQSIQNLIADCEEYRKISNY